VSEAGRCGAGFTQKLEIMFKDMELSADIMRAYSATSSGSMREDGDREVERRVAGSFRSRRGGRVGAHDVCREFHVLVGIERIRRLVVRPLCRRPLARQLAILPAFPYLTPRSLPLAREVCPERTRVESMRPRQGPTAVFRDVERPRQTSCAPTRPPRRDRKDPATRRSTSLSPSSRKASVEDIRRNSFFAYQHPL
jgi:hypothetical protein